MDKESIKIVIKLPSSPMEELEYLAPEEEEECEECEAASVKTKKDFYLKMLED